MVSQAKDRQDVQRYIRLALNTALHPTEGKKGKKVMDIEEAPSIEELKDQNTTALTRIITVQILQACNGDKASADWCMKYGALEPPKESQITLETPTFVDDLGSDELGTPLKVDHSKHEDDDLFGPDEESEVLKGAVIYNDPDEST